MKKAGPFSYLKKTKPLQPENVNLKLTIGYITEVAEYYGETIDTGLVCTYNPL